MEKAVLNIDILYIEHNEVDLQKMQHAFKKVNECLEIVTARNYQEALDKLYGKDEDVKITPKVILLDEGLLQKTGFEFLNILRSDLRFIDTHVFLLSDAHCKNEKIALQDLHVKGHIIKPLEYADALNIFWSLQEND